MKLKLIDVIDSVDTLNWLAAQQPGTRAAFQMGRILRPALREVQVEIAQYQATRMSMLERFEAVAPPGGMGEYAFPKGNRSEFQREHRALLDTDLELDLPPVPFEMFKALPWTAGRASSLWWLFDSVDEALETAPVAQNGQGRPAAS